VPALLASVCSPGVGPGGGGGGGGVNKHQDIHRESGTG